MRIGLMFPLYESGVLPLNYFSKSPLPFVIPVKTGELGMGPERKDGGGRAESWSRDFSTEKYSGLQSAN